MLPLLLTLYLREPFDSLPEYRTLRCTLRWMI